MAPLKAVRIVVIEPDPARRSYFRLLITSWGNAPVCFENVSICLDNLELLMPDLVILGHLTFECVSRFLYAAKRIDFHLPILVITDKGEVHPLISMNGFSNITEISPAATPEQLKAVMAQFHRTSDAGPTAGNGSRDWPMIVGATPGVAKIKKTIFDLAQSSEALLIQGENGTGKDLLARAVHFWTHGHEGAFVKIDSAAISQDLLQQDLSKWFGFPSGRPECRCNVFEVLIRSSGTVFFDDIHLMPFDLQGSLLSLFEDRANRPDLSQDPAERVRIVASTSEDLENLTGLGKFRKDLFYRLNVFHIHLPPLRRRRTDVPLLVDFFTDKYCHEIGKGHYTVPEKTRQLYAEYDWPGNVRELEAIVKRSVIVGDECGFIESLCRSRAPRMQWEDLQGASEHVFLDTEELKSYMNDLDDISLKKICRKFIMKTEKTFMKQALERTDWNRRKAAELLNISYKSLRNKIKVYNLTADR
jgi:DNA-binding NtrC family response regulator